MSIFHYNLRVYNCRGNGQTDTTVTSSNKAALRLQTRPNQGLAWEFAFSSTNVEEPVAHGQFMDAFNAAQGTAPNNVSYTAALGEGETGSLDLALTDSALAATFQTASEGPWHQRIGKQLFRYEIGISTVSGSHAIDNLFKHNLS